MIYYWGMKWISCFMVLFLAGCASNPPRQPENLCSIFREKGDWYGYAREASERWGTPIPVIMSIMYQESSYQANARPPRGRFLWIFPGRRPSSAYGYAQVTDPTWEDYLRDAGSWSASRTDFEDAVDFIGWYNALSARRNGIALHDARRLYLAYHEGHTGYRRGTWQKKQWLSRTATRVASRANTYRAQLAQCEEGLQRSWWQVF